MLRFLALKFLEMGDGSMRKVKVFNLVLRSSFIPIDSESQIWNE